MSTDCASVRTAIGAYVLGGLDADETAAVERHLAECAACRAEHAELADLPRLLSHVSLEQVESPVSPEPAPEPSETGLRRLLDRVHAERARRRRRVRVAVAGAAAAVVLVAAGGIAVGTQWPDGPTGTTENVEVWQAADASTNVSVTATLEPFGWGTRVDAVMSGMRTGDICVIRVIDKSGNSWDAGSWLVGERTDNLRWAGDVAVPLGNVARVEIWEGGSNRRLVSTASES